MSKTANQIRQEFVDFFEQRGHSFVPSAPVVPHDDPTLLFTNAGMNQFKNIFLGENPKGLKRAANSQKCMRVSGKHNDLEEVGRDHFHHTFFEMLGNWSFGDYYKKEAITWAWELLTEVWGLPKDRLFVTVYKSDNEAAELWKSETDIEPDRILPFGDKDNFWEMGDTGPCGPCSEIHYDLGDLSTQADTFRDPVEGVNGENARYREIWNLVFIQYNRAADGTLTELPSKHVDTGMGFERITAIIQDVDSNYDTDLFTPITARLEQMSGRKYSAGVEGTPFRVAADHIRSLVFAITDGAFPSNEGRGYVLRRLLRRGFRFGRELGLTEPFLHKLVPTVVEMMGGAFPEIAQRVDYVTEVIRAEEERFAQTLEQGIEIFTTMIEKCEKEGNRTLPGNDVFVLYDTYGFPMDLTRLMAEERGYGIDDEGFEKLMSQQRERARDARKGDEGLSSEGWVKLRETQGTQFVGYEEDVSKGLVTRYKQAGDNEYLLSMDRTPFYAESGGQVGDKGVLTTGSGKHLSVVDTFKWHDSTVHKVVADAPVVAEDFAEPLHGEVESSERAATRRNHSATHLLQAALRKTLGDHVQQSGSRVDPAGLRFDFTHFKALSASELQEVEQQVNEWVLQDLPVSTAVESVDKAKQGGAIALFGEKYDENVRVVSMGPVSKELCGGTHVSATGQIGLFHITGESSIAAGVRRIEATTGLGTLAFFQNKERTLGELASVLKTGEDKLPERVNALLDSVKDLEAKVAELSTAGAASQVNSLFDESNKKADGAFAWLVKDVGSQDKKAFGTLTDALSDELKRQGESTHVFVLGAEVGGKALFSACAGPAAVKKFGVHCGEIVKTAAKVAGGGGGGSPIRAQAGGKDPGKLSEALAAAEAVLKEKASAT